MHFERKHDNENDEDSEEFLQDVPYSSSSVDRSSIGSIPWADDAIKKNQSDWERVERLLAGEEAAPDEPELCKEIEEWQRKFPQINKWNQQATFYSLDDNDKYNGLVTPRINDQRALKRNALQQGTLRSPYDRSLCPTAESLIHLLNKNLYISSATINRWGQQGINKTAYWIPQYERSYSSASTVTSSVPPTTPISTLSKPNRVMSPSPINVKSTNSANIVLNRLRMPPIQSVMETERCFRGIAARNNNSFTQLTKVQNVKSLADSYQMEQRTGHGKKPVWRTPLGASSASGRFLNNRNSIVLPAINMQRIHEQIAPSPINDSNISLCSGSCNEPFQHNAKMLQDFRGPTGTYSSKRSSTGRSISAAVQHPHSRLQYNEFYLPYSASKFKQFK